MPPTAVGWQRFQAAWSCNSGGSKPDPGAAEDINKVNTRPAGKAGVSIPTARVVNVDAAPALAEASNCDGESYQRAIRD